MFSPSSFLYFFQLLNNWPRFAVFVWDNTVVPAHSQVDIHVSRPRIMGSTPFLTGFANSAQEMQANYGLVHLSTCSFIQSNSGNLSFVWEISKSEGLFTNITTKSCRTSFTAPKQDMYSVNLVVRDFAGNIIAASHKEFMVADLWIVAIGDSFSSGDGNPDLVCQGNRRAKWLSEECHRSGKSWAYQVYERLALKYADYGVHFTFLSCTGASVDDGVLSMRRKAQSQLDVISTISNKFEISPDIVMMSVGGNDIGYADILNSLVLGEAQQMFDSVEMRFWGVAEKLERVAQKLNSLGAKQVIFPHYFDITRNEDAQVDSSCTDLRQISDKNLRRAEESIFQRLNRLISKKCAQHGWLAAPATSALFLTRGACSSRSLIRSVSESLDIQGDTLGAFHPTEEGHTLVAEQIWLSLERHL